MNLLSEMNEYYIILNNEKYNIKNFNLISFNVEKKSDYYTLGWLDKTMREIPRYKVSFSSNYFEVKSFYFDTVSDNRVLEVLNVIKDTDNTICHIINLEKEISNEYKKRPIIDWTEIMFLEEEINNNINKIKEVINEHKINILTSDVDITMGLYEAISIPKIMISIYEKGVI